MKPALFYASIVYKVNIADGGVGKMAVGESICTGNGVTGMRCPAASSSPAPSQAL